MLRRWIRFALRAAPIRLWAIILAAPVLTVTAVALTLIVWRGGWPVSLAPKQLEILGWTLLANWALIGAIVVALCAVKLKASAPNGINIEIDTDTNDPVLRNMEAK